MDIVIITYSPDIKLLRHCIASYDLYYQDKDSLFIFASKNDQRLLEQIELPHNASILFLEDHPELVRVEESRHAAYLKLTACKIVKTEYFCVIDSDFLFIAPIYDKDFFHNGKPIWFYREPFENDKTMSQNIVTEGFIGEKVDYVFMDIPQYVFKRSVAFDLISRFPPLNIPTFEFIVYGWFAHKYHCNEYEFARSDKDNIKAIAGLVNQIPPTYLHLDPSCKYDQFKDYKMVVFWSNWDIANEKMIEFFEDSQKANFGRVVRQSDRKPLLSIVNPNNIAQGRYRYFEGVFGDGWVKETVTFGLIPPADWQSAELELMVPQNPMNPDWELPCTIRLNDASNGENFILRPGVNKLPIPLLDYREGRTLKVELRFGKGFYYTDNPDRREIRTRLMAIRSQVK